MEVYVGCYIELPKHINWKEFSMNFKEDSEQLYLIKHNILISNHTEMNIFDEFEDSQAINLNDMKDMKKFFLKKHAKIIKELKQKIENIIINVGIVSYQL